MHPVGALVFARLGSLGAHSCQSSEFTLIQPERHLAEILCLELPIQRADLRTLPLLARQTPLGVERHYPLPIPAGAGTTYLLRLEGGVADDDHRRASSKRNALDQLRCQVCLRVVLASEDGTMFLGIKRKPIRNTQAIGGQQQSEDEAVFTAAVELLLVAAGLLGAFLGVAARVGVLRVLALLTVH